MANWEAYYKQVVRDLTQIHTEAQRAAASSQQASERARAQVSKRCEQLDQEIRQLQIYAQTAQYYVTAADLAYTPTPASASLERLSQQYDQARMGVGSWLNLYREARAGVAYLERQKEQIRRSQPAPANQAVSTAQLDAKCRAVLMGEHAARLAREFQTIDSQNALVGRLTRDYTKPRTDAPCIIGKAAVQLPVPVGCRDQAEQVFGANYKPRSGHLLVPVDASSVILLQTPHQLMESVMGGLRAYALNVLCSTRPVPQKICFIDALTKSDRSLGVLAKIARLSKQAVAPVPTTAEEVRFALKDLLHMTDKRPGRRVLIYRYNPAMHDGHCDEVLQRLCANAAATGLTVLIVQAISDHDGRTEDRVPGFLSADARIFHSPTGRYMVDRAQKSQILWYNEPGSIPEDYLQALCDAYEPEVVVTEYLKVASVPRTLTYRRDRKKPLSLLFGVDEEGRKHTLDLTGMDFSAFILGGSRSGKSNLLNVLITDAIVNYHPDDLELWLVDFGRTEFSRYLEHTPPHVRYLLVDKTSELIRNLIKGLLDELNRRASVLIEHGALEISELPESVHMPRMLVLIDEFGVLKTIMDNNESGDSRLYRSYLTTLLKQGAKHGMHFIFSDQSFSDASTALSEEARNQMGMRLTLTAEKAVEMLDALGAKGNATDDETSMLRNLPRFHVVYRSREKGRAMHGPVKVLYLPGPDKSPEQPQLIARINRTLSPTGRGRMDPANVYVPHERRMLAENAVPELKQRQSAIVSDIRSWRRGAAYNPGDILVYPGDPRTMAYVHHELLRNERNSNMVLYGSYSVSLSGMVRVIRSVTASCRIQRVPVEFWCAPRNPLGRTILNSRAMVGTKLSDGAALSNRLRQLVDQWTQKKLRPRMIVLAGIGDLMRGVMDDKGEAEAMAMLRGRSSGSFRSSRSSGSSGGLSGDVIRGLVDRGITEESDDSFREERRESEPEFDIQKALSSLMEYAPRYGLHFLVAAQYESELAEVGLAGNLYSHYMGFPTGGRDVSLRKFVNLTAELTDQSMFGCLTSTEFMIYMPYR